jgi:predicted amidophosphoribosyltransferase
MKGNFLSFIKDLIAPKKCYSCNIEGHFLCKNCFNKLSKFKSICYVCKKPSESFSVHNECKNGIYYDKIIILTHYRDNIISKLIKNSKFYNKKDILEDFSKYLSKLLESNLNIKNNKNILASVPMTFFKKMKR